MPQVDRLINGYGHGIDGLCRTLDSKTRTLRVAALPSAMHLLAGPLMQWIKRHPDVALRLSDPLNDELLAALQRGEMDVAVGDVLDVPQQIKTHLVTQDALVAVLPCSHRLATRTTLNWQDITGERLALFARGSTYDLAMATLRQDGADLAHADKLFYSGSLYSLVRAGLAIGVVSELYFASLQGNELRVCPLQAPVVSRRIALMAFGPAQAHSPLIQDCMEFLKDLLKAK